MTDLIERARRYATEAHARIDQRRKYSNQPYDAHLRRVALLVKEVSDDDDEEVVAAAWLHDTVEDTPATFRDIEQEFGAAIAQLVAELTDVSKPSDGNRAVRKAIDRDHLAGASARAKTVKLADLIDNCRDICSHDPKFARIFLGEMEALLRVLTAGNAVLLERAHKTWNKCRFRLDQQTEEATAFADAALSQQVGISARSAHSLRLFARAFTALDIAEPLASFDSDTAALKAAEIMRVEGWLNAGIRSVGMVDGYVRAEDMTGGVCADHRRAFSRGQVVDADASLSEVIFVLTRYRACYVKSLGTISAIILREHIQKPIVRMWLFGMITIIELRVTERLAKLFPDDSWRKLVSPGRLANAEKLSEERTRRGQHPRLLDCLQLSDKIQILIRDDRQMAWMGFDSKRVAKTATKDFESLRNNLAHAQDIVSDDWAQIARMTQRIEELLGHDIA